MSTHVLHSNNKNITLRNTELLGLKLQLMHKRPQEVDVQFNLGVDPYFRCSLCGRNYKERLKC